MPRVRKTKNREKCACALPMRGRMHEFDKVIVGVALGVGVVLKVVSTILQCKGVEESNPTTAEMAKTVFDLAKEWHADTTACQSCDGDTTGALAIKE